MIILVGESASGKTTVAKLLQEKYGMKMITTYTTRPMRDGEVNGVDYYFIDREKFEDLQMHGFFAETAEYRGWLYGSSKYDYLDDNNVVVLTPHGLRQVKRVFNGRDDIHIESVYLSIPRRDRLVKLLQRGDNIEEAYRRSLSDVGQFDGIEDEVNYIVYNDGYTYDPYEVAKIIMRLVEISNTAPVALIDDEEDDEYEDNGWE